MASEITGLDIQGASGPTVLLLCFSSKGPALTSTLAKTILFSIDKNDYFLWFDFIDYNAGIYFHSNHSSSKWVCDLCAAVCLTIKKMACSSVWLKNSGSLETEYSLSIPAVVLTWYVLSKLSYMNRVIRDVFPTARQKKKQNALHDGHVSVFSIQTLHKCNRRIGAFGLCYGCHCCPGSSLLCVGVTKRSEVASGPDAITVLLPLLPALCSINMYCHLLF